MRYARGIPEFITKMTREADAYIQEYVTGDTSTVIKTCSRAANEFVVTTCKHREKTFQAAD